jgi:hypothetical protein
MRDENMTTVLLTSLNNDCVNGYPQVTTSMLRNAMGDTNEEGGGTYRCMCCSSFGALHCNRKLRDAWTTLLCFFLK